MRRLAIVFCGVAVVLWLVPLLSPHSILFPGGPIFEDILVYKGRFTVYHSLKFFTSRAFSAFAYPPGAAPIYAAFYATTDSVETYLLIAASASLFAVVGVYVYLHRLRATQLFPLFLLASFPLVFLIQRANIEIILWIIVATGILAYRRGMTVVAAVLFGLAASVKLYPIFMLGLFLRPAIQRSRRDLTAFVVGLATAVVSLIAAATYSGPTLLIAARGFTTGVSHFQDHYVDAVSKVEVNFDHSLFSPIKFWAFQHHASPAPFTHTYYLVAGSVALLLFVRIRSLPFLNRLVFLVTAMVCLPPVSFDYTLVHLYLPVLFLVATLATTRGPIPGTSLATCALLLFVMLPVISLSVVLPGFSATQPFPAGPIQSSALLLILILSTLKPWPSPPGTSNL